METIKESFRIDSVHVWKLCTVDDEDGDWGWDVRVFIIDLCGDDDDDGIFVLRWVLKLLSSIRKLESSSLLIAIFGILMILTSRKINRNEISFLVFKYL